MVEIMWLGQACFYIRCNGTSIVLDPYFQQEKVGCCMAALVLLPQPHPRVRLQR